MSKALGIEIGDDARSHRRSLAFSIIFDNYRCGPNLEVVRGSVTDFDLVRNVISGASLVFHLAARNIIVSTRNPREDYEVNIGGTLNVLLAARELNVPRVVCFVI